VGYLSDQIRQFCGQAYPDRDITFVTVEDYTSDKSGTATTLLACEPLIHGAFWYVPCDTYFDQCVHDVSYDENVYYTRTVSAADTKLYTIFELDATARIRNVVFKQQYATEQAAFTGLMYINDWAEFFDQLNARDTTEFVDIIAATSRTIALESWLDFGCPQIYQTELSKSRTFDFTKKDELTYICNNRVVKWWLDGTIAEKKYLKVQSNPSVFPDNCTFDGHYMAYDYFEGQTLYEFNRVDKFDSLLSWLDSEVWHKTTDNITQASSEFYKTKSLQRIDKFLAMNPNLQTINFVDNVPVKHYSFYLNRIDWTQLSQVTQTGFMHGDLQFDNIVIDSAYNFKLIDWRHEFAGLVTIGDIYYDLAKMMGGLIINYARIKQHNFDIQILDDAVTLSIPSVDNIDSYKQKLESYVVANNLDLNKVRTLVPIIFWNMSPLHSQPFDQFLWYLGIKLFAEMDL
jgi:thiamine kinase-like enzyme